MMGQHAVDDRRGEELAEGSGTQEAEGHLHDARHHPDRDGHSIGAEVGLGVGPSGEAERLHRAEHDHDHAGGGPLDRELRVAEDRAAVRSGTRGSRW